MAYDVFISYSSKDKVAANAVCAVLEGRNIRCWIAPRDVQPGQPYGEAIIDGIHGCRIMVLIFSSNANVSGHIPKEVERAVSHGVTIIPLRIEDVTPAKSLDYFIGSVHWLDAMTPPLEKHLANLADTIERILQSKPTRPAAADATVIAAEPRSVAAAAKPVAPPAAKRSLPSSAIYGGLAVLVVAAVAFGWYFGREKPSVEVAVQSSPTVATAQAPSQAAPITAEPQTSPQGAEGNQRTRVAGDIPPSLPAKPSAPSPDPLNSLPPNPAPAASNSAGSAAILTQSADPAGLRNQGLYYRDKVQDYDLAIKAFDQAIRLQPNFPEAIANRGDTYLFMGNYNRAVEDYNEVIRQNPGFTGSFHRRGIIRLILGQFGPAKEDLRQAIDSNQPNPDRPYDPIWLYVAETKNGENPRADLARYAGKLNMTNWPGPVTRLFLGTANPDAVLLGAKDPNSDTNARQQCQAYYFVGEYALFGGQRANAPQLFQQSIGTGQTRQFAYMMAKSELDRLRK